MQSNAGLQMILVEPALSQRSRNSGMVSIHSVHTSVTFQRLKCARKGGTCQGSFKRYSHQRDSIRAEASWSCDRLRRVSAGLFQRESN